MRFIFVLLIFSSSPILSIEKSTNMNVEQVVVYGIRPGPELWKVSNGENVLWIMGTLSPLPKKMTWHSQIVEAVLEDSQALLLPPIATTEIGFFKGISLASAAVGIKKNPDKKKLKDVLPTELYARWLVLKKKYIGRDRGVEKTRPIFASQKLFNKAIKKIGLVFDAGVKKKVRKIAKKNKLEIIKPTILFEIKKPKAAIKKFKKAEISDIECFTKTIDRLETDIKILRIRAHAWANGDIKTIKESKYSDQDFACGSAFMKSEMAEDTGIIELPARLRVAWVDEAKKLLSENKSTFALLPISNLLSDDGFLKSLAAEGFTIDVPK